MNNYWNGDLFYKTIEFAQKKHEGQKIMLSQMPYIGHVFEVFGECVSGCLEDNANINWDYLMQVALLHDTLEDTNCTYNELCITFNKEIADGVSALTKNTDLPYNLRIQDSLRRIKLCKPEIALIKLADRIVNLQEKPIQWDNNKLINYKQDAELILEEIGYVSKTLSYRLQQKIENYL